MCLSFNSLLFAVVLDTTSEILFIGQILMETRNSLHIVYITKQVKVQTELTSLPLTRICFLKMKQLKKKKIMQQTCLEIEGFR